MNNLQTKPEFIKRLDENDITPNHCFNCLMETEKTIKKGNWKKFSKPIYYWYEMCDAEGKEIKRYVKKIKPETVLEIGFGSGRTINVLLEDKNDKKIYAVEKDIELFKIVKPLFESFNNVYLFQENVNKFLNGDMKYDLTFAMMNTLGNIDSLETMRLIANKSKHLIFTLYDQKHYKLRKEIYESKGHNDFFEKDKNYYFNDCWVKGLKSKTYSKKEIKDVCKAIGKNFTIKKISKLLFLVHIYD